MSVAGWELPWQCAVCKARFFRQNLLQLHNDNFHNDILVAPANYEHPALPLSPQLGLRGKIPIPKRNNTRMEVINVKNLNETPRQTVSTEKIVETIYKKEPTSDQNYLDEESCSFEVEGSSDSVESEDPNEGELCFLVVDQDGGMFMANKQHLQDAKNSGDTKLIHTTDSTEETNGNYTKNKTNAYISQSGEYTKYSKENRKAVQHTQIANSTAQDTSVSDHTDPVIRRIIAKISHFKGIKPAAPREAPEFPCKWCDNVFTTKHERRLHLETHAKDLRYVCSVCGRGFHKHVSLRAHSNVHVEGKHHQCPHCNKMYRSDVYLKKHMKMHDPSELKYQCLICEKRFLCKDRCDYHMKTHSAEAPYGALCGKGYRARSGLKSHMMTHEGAPSQHPCFVCEKSFRQRSALAQHMRAHTS